MLLLWFVISLVPLPESVPKLVTPYGKAIAENRAQSFMVKYCLPIKAWEPTAYELCLESGLNINRAVLFSNNYSCNTRPELNECKLALTLYRDNFRLWQGSVDNISRAKGYNLAQAKVKNKAKVHKNLKVVNNHQSLKFAEIKEPTSKVEAKDRQQAEPKLMETKAGSASVKLLAKVELPFKIEPSANPEIAAKLQLQQQRQCQHKLAPWFISSEIKLDSLTMQLQSLELAIASLDIIQIKLLLKTIAKVDFAPAPILVNCDQFADYNARLNSVKLAITKLQSLQATKIATAKNRLKTEQNSINWLFVTAIALVIAIFILLIYLYRKKS